MEEVLATRWSSSSELRTFAWLGTGWQRKKWQKDTFPNLQYVLLPTTGDVGSDTFVATSERIQYPPQPC